MAYRLQRGCLKAQLPQLWVKDGAAFINGVSYPIPKEETPDATTFFHWLVTRVSMWLMCAKDEQTKDEILKFMAAVEREFERGLPAFTAVRIVQTPRPTPTDGVWLA